MKHLDPVVSDRKSDLQTKKTGNYENTKIRLPEKSGSDPGRQPHGQIFQNSTDQVLRSSANHNDHCYFINVCRLQKSFRRKFAVGEWFYELKLRTRGNLPPDYKQDYALIIQIIDESSSVDVYNFILNEHGD